MNIAFVNSTRKWGGVKSWTLDVAHGLALRGHHVRLVGRPGPFVDKALEKKLSAVGLRFGPDFNPALILKFVRMFMAQRTELVVVNVGKDMRTAGIAARLLGIPVVHRVGLAGDMDDTFKVRALHRWIKPRILVPCQQIQRGLLRHLPYLGAEEITVILTGKEPSPIPPGPVHSPLRFISTSQLNADKGHRDALLALRQLKEEGHSFAYHVVGTGRIEEELKRMCVELGLDDRVVWHGFQKDVRSVLRQADIFLLPSWREGLPNSLLEAMAEGLVCVARDVGGVSEVWPESAGALLLPEPTTPQELAGALSTLMQRGTAQLLEMKTDFWSRGRNNSLDLLITTVEEFFFKTAGGQQ